MPVTDSQVAALRALLVDDLDLHRQLFDELDRGEAKRGYPALVTAAFGEAVERRFGGNSDPGEIVRFVADVRARSDRLAREIDPDVAERTILSALGTGSVQGADRQAVAQAKLILLVSIVADYGLDGEMLDAFLASARKLADQLMS